MPKESPFEVVIQPWTRSQEDFDETLASVLKIEEDSYSSSVWQYEDFLAVFEEKGVAGVVAVRDGEVIGFAIVCIRKTGIELYNLAVRPKSRRIRVGADIIGYIVAKALTTKVRGLVIHMTVREHNLPAQMFLKSLGFMYTHTVASFYEDTGEDAYVLVLNICPMKNKRSQKP